MPLTVQNLVDDARNILQDTGGVRWSDAEMIDWVNDAVRAAVLLKPDCNPITEEFTCVAGYKQDLSTLSTEIVQLLEVTANTSTGGGTESAITFIKRNVLDSENPSWRTTTPAATLQYYMYDPKQRDIMYVYPPALVGATFEMVYAGVPAEVTVLGDNLPLQDVYGPALTNYVIWRAYGKDSDFGANLQLSNSYYGLFFQMLTGKMLTENREAPDRKVPPPVVEAVG